MSAKLPEDIDCRGKWGHRCDRLYPIVVLGGPSLLWLLFCLIREWVIWTR